MLSFCDINYLCIVCSFPTVSMESAAPGNERGAAGHCKPGSVTCMASLPVIYPDLASPPSSIVLPSNDGRAGSPNDAGLRGLSASDVHSPQHHCRSWWALTPPSHPYRLRKAAVVFFCTCLSLRTPSDWEAEYPVLPRLSSCTTYLCGYTRQAVPAASRDKVTIFLLERGQHLPAFSYFCPIL